MSSLFINMKDYFTICKGANIMQFSERLKQTRIKHGFTQDEFARKLNISASSISLYENGDREPSLATLKTISETLNVSTDYLLGLTEVENNESSKCDTLEKLERRHRILSKAYHPDVGDDEAVFVKMQNEYKNLKSVFTKEANFCNI